MSIEFLKTDYEKLEYFVNLLNSKASGENVSEIEYKELREQLLSNQILQSVMPDFVKTNGGLNSFWRFIQDEEKSYSKRREFLTKEFEPIFQMLQNNQTSLPIVQKKYTHTQDSIKKELKAYFESNKILQNIYGDFTLIDKNIGNGGTSEVKGFKFGDKEYAIKFLLEDISQKETQAFKRFKQAHFNLVAIQHSGAILPQLHFDILEINEIKIPYIVMPRVNDTLKSFVEKKRKPIKSILNYLRKYLKICFVL